MTTYVISDLLIIFWRALLLMLAWGALASVFGFVTIGYWTAFVVTYTATSFFDMIRGEDTLKVHQRFREAGLK